MAAEEMYVLEPMLVPCQTVSSTSPPLVPAVSSSSTFARPDTSFSHDGDGDGAGSGEDADSEQGQRALAAMLAPSQLSACPLPSTSAATTLVAPRATPRGRCRKDVRDPTLVACQTAAFTPPSRPARRPPAVTTVRVPSLPPPRLQLDGSQHRSDGYTQRYTRRRPGKCDAGHKPPAAARPAARQRKGPLRQRRACRGRCG